MRLPAGSSSSAIFSPITNATGNQRSTIGCSLRVSSVEITIRVAHLFPIIKSKKTPSHWRWRLECWSLKNLFLNSTKETANRQRYQGSWSRKSVLKPRLLCPGATGFIRLSVALCDVGSWKSTPNYLQTMWVVKFLLIHCLNQIKKNRNSADQKMALFTDLTLNLSKQETTLVVGWIRKFVQFELKS